MKIAIRWKTTAASFLSSASKICRFQRLMPYWTLTFMTISASRPRVSGQASFAAVAAPKALGAQPEPAQQIAPRAPAPAIPARPRPRLRRPRRFPAGGSGSFSPLSVTGCCFGWSLMTAKTPMEREGSIGFREWSYSAGASVARAAGLRAAVSADPSADRSPASCRA